MTLKTKQTNHTMILGTMRRMIVLGQCTRTTPAVMTVIPSVAVMFLMTKPTNQKIVRKTITVTTVELKKEEMSKEATTTQKSPREGVHPYLPEPFSKAIFPTRRVGTDSKQCTSDWKILNNCNNNKNGITTLSIPTRSGIFMNLTLRETSSTRKTRSNSTNYISVICLSQQVKVQCNRHQAFQYIQQF